MSTKKPSLPLQPTLGALDRGEFGYLSAQDAEHQKSFSAWMIMRYASSAAAPYTEHYLLMVNDIVNVGFSALRKHPELQWKLLCVCGVGQSVKHPWIAPGRRASESPVVALLREVYPDAKSDDLHTLAEITDKAQLVELAQSQNWSTADINKLKKRL